MKVADSQFYVYSRWDQGGHLYEHEDFFVVQALYDFDEMHWGDWIQKYKRTGQYSFHKPEILGNALSDLKYHNYELPIADDIITDIVFENGKAWRYNSLLVIMSTSSDNAESFISRLRKQKDPVVDLPMTLFPVIRKNSWEEF